MDEAGSASAQPIADVSDTAFMVAVYRAVESARPDALFHDPLAERLAGERGRRIVAGLREVDLACWSVSIRTCTIDALIQDAIAGGVDTVLNLGAGLDTRPYRMALPKSLRWIEVDCPHVIELKTERLADVAPVCALQRIKLDLADRAACEACFQAINAEAGKVLALTEGVILYLGNDEVAALADALLAQPKFSNWIVDYLSPLVLEMRKRAGSAGDYKNAPWRFEVDDFFGFFARHGWRAAQVRYYHDEARRLHRRAPVSRGKAARYLLRYLFASPAQRDALRKMAGHVLLDRAPAM